MDTSIFEKIAAMAMTAGQRLKKEHDEWLDFFKELVEVTPSDVVVMFGNMNDVKTKDRRGDVHTHGIELTVADFLYWRDHFEAGHRFVGGPEKIKMRMLKHLAKKAEAQPLEPAERKALLALLTK